MRGFFCSESSAGCCGSRTSRYIPLTRRGKKRYPATSNTEPHGDRPMKTVALMVLLFFASLPNAFSCTLWSAHGDGVVRGGGGGLRSSMSRSTIPKSKSESIEWTSRTERRVALSRSVRIRGAEMGKLSPAGGPGSRMDRNLRPRPGARRSLPTQGVPHRRSGLAL